jgi:Mn2+/Fe2+ NRAMP family transporter
MEPPADLQDPPARTAAPIPRTFGEYLRSLGPGIVVALTWLGAGDIVDAAVSGANYGYALMWALALALVIRWVFVSTVAKYQLCNERGESVLEGLRRLHAGFPLFILVASLVYSHAVNVYMYQGLVESCQALAGGGPAWAWAVGWSLVFLLVVWRPVFRRVEWVFLAFLGLLGVSLIGAAARVGPDVRGILAGTVGFRLPPEMGGFAPLLIVTSLVGAVAGSLANLLYPYFIRDKGWNSPAYRRVQLYDLGFGVLMIIVLDLAVWVLGAQVLHPRGLTVKTTHDLAQLLTGVMGSVGGVLIYLGIFAAVASSIVGNALGYGYMATDAYLLWRPPPGERPEGDYRRHPGYRWVVLWVLFSPLPWVLAGKADFVRLTVAVNAIQVVLLPILAGGLWAITANPRFIGAAYRNRPWENALMAALFALALAGAYTAARSLIP